jgi:hypothetical protein
MGSRKPSQRHEKEAVLTEKRRFGSAPSRWTGTLNTCVGALSTIADATRFPSRNEQSTVLLDE